MTPGSEVRNGGHDVRIPTGGGAGPHPHRRPEIYVTAPSAKCCDSQRLMEYPICHLDRALSAKPSDPPRSGVHHTIGEPFSIVGVYASCEGRSEEGQGVVWHMAIRRWGLIPAAVLVSGSLGAALPRLTARSLASHRPAQAQSAPPPVQQVASDGVPVPRITCGCSSDPHGHAYIPLRSTRRR